MLVLLPQVSSNISAQNSYSLSSRVNPNIINYQWRIGSSIIPNKMVILRNDTNTAGFGEAFIEVLKIFHGFNNLNASQSLIGMPEYFVWDQAASLNNNLTTISTNFNSYNNAFAIAQDLEFCVNRSDTILQGINTIG